MISQDLTALWACCSESYQLSETHGPTHWRQVQANGLIIAKENGADGLFVRLFAVLHDSCRLNEGADPDHGQRAASLAAQLRGKLFKLDDPMFQKLEACLINHDKGQTSDDLETATCWDADRLDLPRVGVRIDPRYLSTAVARRMARP